MSGQVADGGEAAAPRFVLHRAPDLVDRTASLRGGDALLKSRLGEVAQLLLERRDWRHGDGCAGIGVVAVQFRRYVNVHQVARLDDALAGDAVRGFVIEADTGAAGEVVGQAGGRTRAVLRQKGVADGVQFGGGHPYAHLFLHVL